MRNFERDATIASVSENKRRVGSFGSGDCSACLRPEASGLNNSGVFPLCSSRVPVSSDAQSGDLSILCFARRWTCGELNADTSPSCKLVSMSHCSSVWFLSDCCSVPMIASGGFTVPCILWISPGSVSLASDEKVGTCGSGEYNLCV